MSQPLRPPSQLDLLADRLVDDYAASIPETATYIGVPGHDDRWSDLTPEGHGAHAQLLRAGVGMARTIQPVDHREEVARAAMIERLGAELARYEAGWAQAALNTVESPLSEFRITMSMMPTASEQDWVTIARRLTALPRALDGYLAGLTEAASHGRTAAARQVRLAAATARRWAGTPSRPGYFAELAASAPPGPAGLTRDLDGAAQATSAALLDFADRLESGLLPLAPERDAVGRERYAVESRYHAGIDLDL